MKILPVLALSLLASSALFAGPPEGSGRQPTTGLVAEEVKRLLADGVVAFSKGDYATARGLFETAYQIDSRNLVAINYLQKIKVLEKGVSRPMSQERQLAGVIVPKVQLKDATIGAVFDYLKSMAAKLTEGKVAVNFVLKLPEETVKTQTISLSMSGVPYTEVVKYVAELANLQVEYQQYAVLVTPKPGAAPAPAVAPVPVEGN
jgi:hypothetical protein